MIYKGSCHCGQIAFEVNGNLEMVMECNCSICSKRGALHWMVPRAQFRLLTPGADLASYSFGKHRIRHRFCPTCGSATFGEGTAPNGQDVVAVNARCLEDVDLASLEVGHFDGRSL